MDKPKLEQVPLNRYLPRWLQEVRGRYWTLSENERAILDKERALALEQLHDPFGLWNLVAYAMTTISWCINRQLSLCELRRDVASAAPVQPGVATPQQEGRYDDQADF